MKIRTWAVGALLAATSVAAGLGIPTASADDPTPTVNSCSSGPETKPSEMAILCDNTLRVEKNNLEQLERCSRIRPWYSVSGCLRTELRYWDADLHPRDDHPGGCTRARFSVH